MPGVGPGLAGADTRYCPDTYLMGDTAGAQPPAVASLTTDIEGAQPPAAGLSKTDMDGAQPPASGFFTKVDIDGAQPPADGFLTVSTSNSSPILRPHFHLVTHFARRYPIALVKVKQFLLTVTRAVRTRLVTRVARRPLPRTGTARSTSFEAEIARSIASVL